VIRAALVFAGLAVSAQAGAQVTFYENDGFQGRSFTTQKTVSNFESFGFNDRASSVVVSRDRWEVCNDARFEGRCIVLRPGNYPSLASMGLNDRISSVRNVSRDMQVNEDRYAPAPLVTYDARRRGKERIYQADVTSVRAVVGPAEQRCWVEREQVSQRGEPNIGGAIAGAVIGGILGHQVGSGRGNDVATVGGAVAGGAIGANVGRGGGQSSGRDVQRCETVASNARPDHWEVTYSFRGREHHVQMTNPPGTTINVNEQGEPRA
jgi:uncharacterized protein YcfJ